MRQWISLLLNNPAAAEDFLKWCEGSESSLAAQTKEAVLEEDYKTARNLASEQKVYENMRRKFTTELRERNSQLKYQESLK